MKTNLEKWNYYLSIIENRTNGFIDLQKRGVEIPEIYYIVYPNGKVAARTIIGIDYSHHRHGGKTYFYGKKPTRKDVAGISVYSATDILFSSNNIWFKYSEKFGKEKEFTSTSSVGFNDVINKKNVFYSMDEAEHHAATVLQQFQENKEFQQYHKKDKNYNYPSNGYKFLGWQNGWKHVYFDEDGNLCSETNKPNKTFGYTTVDYPEYGKCRDLKHRRIEVSHNQRGSEHTVSCPECKIYWKYDSSD